MTCNHEEIHYNYGIAECFDCKMLFNIKHNHEGTAEFEKVQHNKYRCFDCLEQIQVKG